LVTIQEIELSEIERAISNTPTPR